MRRLLPLLVAGCLAAGTSGCAAMMGAVMHQNVQHHNAEAPTFYIPQPEALAHLRKIVVPDFRIRSATGKREEFTLYPGTVGEGLVQTAAPEFGAVAAEFVEEALLRLPGLDVLERNQLKQLLAEQHMQMSGLVDNPSLESGRLAGADAMVLGTVSMGLLYTPKDPFLPTLLAFGVHIRLLDLKTGRILMVYRDRQLHAGVFPDQDGLMERLARRFTERLQAARQAGP